MACSVWASTRRNHDSLSICHGSKGMKPIIIHDEKDVVTIQSSESSESHDHLNSTLLGRSNLDCFLDHITPSITVSCPPKGMVEDSIWRHQQYNDQSMCAFTLDELWRCYEEWSVYGAGVPLALPCGSETIMQYYVPYLSAMQIYLHPSFNKRRSGDESDWSDMSDTRSVSDFGSDNENEKTSRLHMKCDQWDSLSSFSSDRLSSVSSELGDRHGDLIFEYFEQSSPYGRTPLAGKIRELAIDFPQLYTLRSNELSPASWVSVAWYPIYRIPTGPTMSHLSTCFLTFHTLWIPPLSQDTQSDCGTRKNNLFAGFENNFDTCSIKSEPSIVKHEQEQWFHDHASWRIKSGKVVELPPFGLVSYKLGGPFWALARATDKRRMTSLANCADSWLRQLKVQHPDFDFFASRERRFNLTDKYLSLDMGRSRR